MSDFGEDRLTRLQRAVLRAFSSAQPDFFLTGGAALAGFYLRHRSTRDLDFFCHADGKLDGALDTLERIAEQAGARFTLERHEVDFARAVVQTADDAVVIDLVRDRVQPRRPMKPVLDGVRVDAVEEIFINKITTLVSRQEERDLVDVMALERTGLRVEELLPEAQEKDGGATAATIAWLLESWHGQLDDDEAFPGGASGREIKAYMAELSGRLRAVAFPGPTAR